MRGWWKLWLAGAALVVLWAGFAYDVARPADDRSYHRTVVQAAESAGDGARTGWLVGRAELDGRLLPPYTETALDDAVKAVAGASKQFAEETPPDASSARLRDRLATLLSDAARRLTDVAGAEDRAALRSAVQALGALADRLDQFVEANQ